MSVVNRSPELRLIGGFAFMVDGRPVPLTSNARRVLAYLAVRGGVQRRDTVAGQLWGCTSDSRARATLRTALWRVRQAHPGVVHTDREAVELLPQVRLDLRDSTTRAHELVDGTLVLPSTASADLLVQDLLPGWDEDWLHLERERHRQLRIHALEALSRRLTQNKQYADAIDVAYRAIAAEPMRESAHRALVTAHLAEGDRLAAGRQLDLYVRLLDEELGVRPSPAFQALVREP